MQFFLQIVNKLVIFAKNSFIKKYVVRMPSVPKEGLSHRLESSQKKSNAFLGALFAAYQKPVEHGCDYNS
ncbi:MAG: hypothetical protein K0T99_03825 [Alphaproteobacteria bacterium]|nr:hypothetical protein [Alphaproteobacteria bacterium]